MIKTVAFDLDGTLWQTAKSYLYAYAKLCEKYSVAPTASDGDVTAFLGVKLDKLLPALFPGVTDMQSLAHDAVAYSIEYLRAHPDDCCYEGAARLIRTLSRDYDLYIVSNCPRIYAEAFEQISGTEGCFKGFYTIEMGEKSERLARLVQESEGKVLFVGDSHGDYLSIPDPYAVEFCHAAYGYTDSPAYSYRIQKPLDLLSVLDALQTKERVLAGKPWRTFSQGENQITLMHNPDGTAYFGYLQYADAQGFDAAVKQMLAGAQGKPLLGPINGNTFYSYRLAVDSFDWRLYPDCISDPAVLDVLLQNGLVPKQYYTSTLGTVNHKIWDAARKVRLPAQYRVVKASGADAYAYLSDVCEVAFEAFAKADFYEPISRADFMEIYMQGLQAVTPDLLVIYDGDTPIAFNFCYPDPENRFYVCKTTAIRSDYRSRRLIFTVIDHSYRMMQERGHSEVLYHFQNDRTRPLYAIFKDHTVKQKRYALLEYRHEK